ncbi:DUF424 family protein [Methanofollis formosanus]|uniref:DUF424 family protein n=1 Tax=Methanofollis formosanus TaxID=299308 RepID=A0A8G1A0A0_9EURY|nr:DUF424 family protein [Methanofollis formosanus]QYZ78680.1 DUF424 family protein [Methanofollis formosanus]
MYLKVHHTREGAVVAVCDEDLLNTTLCHGDVEIAVTEAFYGSTPATEEEVRAALRGASNANLIGEEAVGVAVAMGLITREGCMTIGNVPHALIFSL